MGLLDDVRDELLYRHRDKVAAENKVAAEKAAAANKAEREALAAESAETKRQLAALQPQVRAAESRAHVEAIERQMKAIAADRSARGKRALDPRELRIRAIKSLGR